MVMVMGKPVNSWGGGHAARPGASRAAARLANISTLLWSGQESKPVTAAVVRCESPVSPARHLSSSPRLAAQESGGHRAVIESQGAKRIPQEPFVQRCRGCIECGRRVMSQINRPESNTQRF